MPQRSIAQDRQRELFADLEDFREIVLTTKGGAALSINIHGSFELFDKHWVTEDHLPQETMLALKQDTPVPANQEPEVHFHIDWEKVKWARIQPRQLRLINTDYEIVFYSEQDGNSRMFWFYLREGIDTQLLLSKWGNGWISLSDEPKHTYAEPLPASAEDLAIIHQWTL